MIRIGLLGLWLGAAAIIYFASLWIIGLRWQNFLRDAK
jgi:putative peptidoglycan lipid II flippase